MVDEDGIKLSDQEILESSLDHLAKALYFVYKLEDEYYHSFAFMVDSCMKLGAVLKNRDDILYASADYTAYEQEVYERKQRLKLIK